MTTLPPRPLVWSPVNHIGITVEDLDVAMSWYAEIFACRVIRGPMDVRRADPDGHIAADVFGDGWSHMRQAHLVASNGVGLELFQFIQPATERSPEPLPYWKTGFFHIAMTVDDVSATAAQIEATGGRRRTQAWETPEGRWFAYCEDPFGNVLELYSHSYEATHANRESLAKPSEIT